MIKIGCQYGPQEAFDRRAFISAGSLGFLGMHLSQALRLEAATSSARLQTAPKAKACILFWLEGGPSQLDTWDP